MIVPLKQGLKQIRDKIKGAGFIQVEMIVPLKQGLKLWYLITVKDMILMLK